MNLTTFLERSTFLFFWLSCSDILRPSWSRWNHKELKVTVKTLIMTDWEWGVWVKRRSCILWLCLSFSSSWFLKETAVSLGYREWTGQVCAGHQPLYTYQAKKNNWPGLKSLGSSKGSIFWEELPALRMPRYVHSPCPSDSPTTKRRRTLRGAGAGAGAGLQEGCDSWRGRCVYHGNYSSQSAVSAPLLAVCCTNRLQENTDSTRAAHNTASLLDSNF